jgi:hypothetical protein
VFRRLITLSVAAALAVGLNAGAAFADHPRTYLGPGAAGVHDIKDKALIRPSKWGFIFIAGQQDSHLTVTFDKDANTLTYVDTGTAELIKWPERCTPLTVDQGIAATCTIPPRFETQRMFVQVWPRLGNDYVDGSTLPKRFRLWVLADAGNDVFYGGDGADFLNGAKDADIAYGGLSKDWLRTGPGDDQLWGGDDKDRMSCAEDSDVAHADDLDTFYQCETIVGDETSPRPNAF